MSNGSDSMNIYLDLYIDGIDKKFVEMKIRDKVISAPFPGILDLKKIVFRSSGEGLLYIEEWDGGEWELYDKIRVEGGRKNSIYIYEGKGALLYRVIYEPHIESTIKEAPVILKQTCR